MGSERPGTGMGGFASIMMSFRLDPRRRQERAGAGCFASNTHAASSTNLCIGNTAEERQPTALARWQPEAAQSCVGLRRERFGCGKLLHLGTLGRTESSKSAEDAGTSRSPIQ